MLREHRIGIAQYFAICLRLAVPSFRQVREQRVCLLAESFDLAPVPG